MKRISPHLVRGPDEPIIPELKQFYDRLLAVLRRNGVRNGDWQLLECVPAWDAAGPGTVFWSLPGKARVKSGWW